MAKAPLKGEPIAIKGMFIGMTTAEFIALPKSEPTIGGVMSTQGYQDPFNLDWNEGRLEGLLFFFKAENFDAVLGAVKGKYPKLQCTTSQIENRMGGKFQQVTCNLRQAGASLMIKRFTGDIETSALGLHSEGALLRRAKATKARESDI
ncbi:hypothetical protein ASC95_01215 [Pelomonas sp. Root1217]|uniref:hypothetical protein n=1 Tax=Pelomonas sp. Root1217 TaxID=1736430 RepID=UPI0007138456|nr:hypothetical protein [Pelomonas sp. Root1217]KQV60126.1 hypothetical protein ASC95_01215 [Pelomonas sp. Root1217]